jgi:hypothetical protein
MKIKNALPKQSIWELFRNNSVYPYALLDEDVSDDTFCKVEKLYAEVDGEDGHCGVVRGDEGEGNGYAPGKAAVEYEGKKRLTARTEGEVDRVRKGKDRHRQSNDKKHRACHLAGVIARVIELWYEV